MGMLEILSREQERKAREAYLYEGEEGNWYAYEHSAELLSDFLKGIVTMKQFIHDTFLILNIVEVDISLLEKCHITSCSDTEMIIACPRETN